MIAVSVIVPFFNAARTLERCLTSLLAQESPAGEYEIIAVDNNSSDASPDLARRDGVQLLAEARQSPYAARNCGLREARGRLIAFTDADCVARRDWLRRLTERMDDPRIMVVMGRELPAGRSRVLRLLGEYGHTKEAFVSAGVNPGAYSGHTNNLMTRRDVFARVGLLDERPRGADVLFVRRVLALHGTASVCYAPDAVVEHLEMDSARAYFRKAFIYGRSARRYAPIASPPALRNVERLRVLRATARANQFSTADTVLLLGLLALGVGVYNLGWLSVGSHRRAVAGGAGVAEPEAQR